MGLLPATKVAVAARGQGGQGGQGAVAGGCHGTVGGNHQATVGGGHQATVGGGGGGGGGGHHCSTICRRGRTPRPLGRGVQHRQRPQRTLRGEGAWASFPHSPPPIFLLGQVRVSAVSSSSLLLSLDCCGWLLLWMVAVRSRMSAVNCARNHRLGTGAGGDAASRRGSSRAQRIEWQNCRGRLNGRTAAELSGLTGLDPLVEY